MSSDETTGRRNPTECSAPLSGNSPCLVDREGQSYVLHTLVVAVIAGNAKGLNDESDKQYASDPSG